MLWFWNKYLRWKRTLCLKSWTSAISSSPAMHTCPLITLALVFNFILHHYQRDISTLNLLLVVIFQQSFWTKATAIKSPWPSTPHTRTAVMCGIRAQWKVSVASKAVVLIVTSTNDLKRISGNTSGFVRSCFFLLLRPRGNQSEYVFI